VAIPEGRDPPIPLLAALRVVGAETGRGEPLLPGEFLPFPFIAPSIPFLAPPMLFIDASESADNPSIADAVQAEEAGAVMFLRTGGGAAAPMKSLMPPPKAAGGAALAEAGLEIAGFEIGIPAGGVAAGIPAGGAAEKEAHSVAAGGGAGPEENAAQSAEAGGAEEGGDAADPKADHSSFPE
jgi:hypothetical protein